MKQTAPGPIDCVFDILPPSVSATVVRAAAMAVRPYGRVVLMGGVGMLGGDDLALPYPWIMRNCVSIRGVWMYPPEATIRLVALVRSGLLKLEHFEFTEFESGRRQQSRRSRRRPWRRLQDDRVAAVIVLPSLPAQALKCLLSFRPCA